MGRNDAIIHSTDHHNDVHCRTKSLITLVTTKMIIEQIRLEIISCLNVLQTLVLTDFYESFLQTSNHQVPLLYQHDPTHFHT